MAPRSLLFLLFVIIPIHGFGASFRPPGRSILRALGDGDAADVAVDLNATTFDASLKRSPATFAVVEFFAHWCPACRNYKPHYEKVARLFNGPEAVHPGIVLMARVDCAMKAKPKSVKREVALCRNPPKQPLDTSARATLPSVQYIPLGAHIKLQSL